MSQDALIPTPRGLELGAPKTARRPAKPPHPSPHVASKHPDGVRASWCRDCRQPILTGLDDLACALPARVDPTPLTPLGELLAKLGDLDTYELRAGRPTRLIRRLAADITARPAEGAGRRRHDTYDVLAAHRCGQTLTGPAAAATRIPPPTSAADATPIDPPF